MKVSWFPEGMFPKWLKTLIKISFWTGFTIFIMLIILAQIGGKDDIFKESVEQFASEATGTHAEILSINNIRFFPNVIINFNDMRFFESQKKAQQIARIGHANVVISFWDVLGHNGRFKFILLEDIFVDAGHISEKTISIQHISTNKANPDPNINTDFFLETRGQIGEYDVRLELPLESHGQHYSRTFILDTQRPSNIQLGEAKLSLQPQHTTDSLELINTNLSLKSKNILNNNIIRFNSKCIVFDKKVSQNNLLELVSYLSDTLQLKPSFTPFNISDDNEISILGHPIIFEQNDNQL